MEKILLRPDRVDELLGKLCVKLGFCLHPVAHLRIVNSPPRTIDRFIDVVLRAEGFELPCHPELRRELRAIVENYFEAAANAKNLNRESAS